MDDRRSQTQGPTPHQAGVTGLPFRVLLTPHRSLSAQGFLLLMAAVGAVSFVMGIAFAWIGAWPVFAFFGLDVALIYVAFRLNYRSGRLYETVEVLPRTLTIQRVHPSGASETFEFQSYWTRVMLSTGRDGRSSLRVGSHGREVVFGQFLTDDERASLAEELSAAIRLARQPA